MTLLRSPKRESGSPRADASQAERAQNAAEDAGDGLGADLRGRLGQDAARLRGELDNMGERKRRSQSRGEQEGWMTCAHHSPSMF